MKNTLKPLRNSLGLVLKDLEFVDGKVLLNGKELTNVRYEDRDDAFYVK